MKFFRATTLGKVVVMGSNTLKSFPNGNPLKNRTNVVLSSKIERDDCIVVKSLEALIEEIKKFPSGDVYVIGGAKLYKTLLPYCDEALVTKIKADGNAEVFFPNLNEMNEWELNEQSQEIESNGKKIIFTKYIKKR
jgi:dihydrofolate reductase